MCVASSSAAVAAASAAVFAAAQPQPHLHSQCRIRIPSAGSTPLHIPCVQWGYPDRIRCRVSFCCCRRRSGSRFRSCTSHRCGISVQVLASAYEPAAHGVQVVTPEGGASLRQPLPQRQITPMRHIHANAYPVPDVRIPEQRGCP